MQKVLFLLTLLISTASSALNAGQIVRLGISSFAEPNTNTPIITSTVQTLTSVLGKDNLVVTHYVLDDLKNAVEKGEVDLILSSGGFYRRISPAGAKDLVTVISARLPDPNQSEGSVFIVRADNRQINKLEEFKGKKLVANLASGFTGYYVAMGELAKRGINWEKLFSQHQFVGSNNMPLVIEAVLRGEADIGILRSCYLEDFVGDRQGVNRFGDLRVIEPRENSAFACAHSTDLYPNWTLATLPTTPPEVSRLVSLSLLQMPTTQDGLFWGVASDFSRIDNLYKTLRIGPYHYLREWTLKRIIEVFWPWLMLACVCIGGLILHGIRVETLIRRRTHELSQSLGREARLEKEARQASERIDAMQKVGTIGQLSSMLAHELRQPLGAIVCYGHGLERLLEKPKKSLDTDLVRQSAKEISEQAKRASDIVEHVRNYAKSQGMRREILDYPAVVQQAINNARAAGRVKCPVMFVACDNLRIEADPLEMELVVVNLLRNAQEAIAKQKKQHIEVVLTQSATDQTQLTISDNGPALSREALDNLAKPLDSSKPEGLGLGLGIVRSIVDRMGGRVSFKLAPIGGLQVTITLSQVTKPDIPVSKQGINI